MRKLTGKIILTIIISLACLTSVNASTNTSNREDLYYYGVNKWVVNAQNKEDILKTYKVDASEKIYDFGDKLTASEETDLFNKINDFVQSTGWDFAIFTENIDYENKTQLDNYARSFYDYNDFGINNKKFDGILLFIDTYPGKEFFNFYTFGDTQLYFDETRINSIGSRIKSSFEQTNYFEGANSLIDYATEIKKLGKAGQYKYSFIDGSGKISKNTCKASSEVKTYNRSELEKYGVNKKWDLSEPDRLAYALKTYKVDASEKIYDFSNILDEDEECELYAQIQDLIEITGWDIVLFIDDLAYTYDSENEDYATDFYDFNDFGIDSEHYDGVLLFRNTYSNNRYYDMYTFGNAQLYFGQARYDDILDRIYDELSNEKYYEGFKLYLKSLSYIYYMGKASEFAHAHIDDMGYIKYDYCLPVIPALAISLIVTIITISIMLSKHRMIKKATTAANYIEKDKTVYSRNEDRFIRSTTSSYHIDSSSGSGGGGGGGFSSGGHSGGGHSSGGGRHG